MYVICDIHNIVRHYSNDIRYITTQTNGVTVGTTKDRAEAIYCNTTNTYWPIKETYVGQPKYTMYQVEDVDTGTFKIDITRYNNGELVVDDELVAIEKEKSDNNINNIVNALLGIEQDNIKQNYIFMSKVRDRSIKIGVLMRENITTSTTQIRRFLCKLRILFQWGATDYSVPACKFCCS